MCSCLVDLEGLCSPQTTSVGGLGEYRHPEKTKRWIFPKPLERDGRVPGPGRTLWPGEIFTAGPETRTVIVDELA